MQTCKTTRNGGHRKNRRSKIRRKRLCFILAFCLLFLINWIFRESNTVSSQESNASFPPSVTDVPGTVSAIPDENGLTADEKLEIIQTSSEYPSDMVEFAQKYPQVIDYVYEYPTCKSTVVEIDLSTEISDDSVPLLIQWDARWGYIPYGDGLIGYTGCGPVCLSMVALYLTGNAEWTPAKVAELSTENGYCVPGNGTSWTLISEGSRSLGLNAEELPLMESTMKNELDRGHPIILVVGPGDFTYSGHYLVVVGYDEDGFRVNDPNSYENSEKTWSYDTLSSQIRNLWAISRAASSGAA